jgi:hypothetical protein
MTDMLVWFLSGGVVGFAAGIITTLIWFREDRRKWGRPRSSPDSRALADIEDLRATCGDDWADRNIASLAAIHRAVSHGK